MVRRSMFVAVVLTVSLFVSAFAIQGTPSEGVVTGDRVNLRAGPSKNDPSLGFATKGDRLTILAEKAGWYQVRCPHQVPVWMHSKYLNEQGVVTGSRVNLRARPNTSHTPLGQVKKGDLVQVQSKKGDWTRIMPPASASVWISSKYVEATGMSARTGPRTTPAGARRAVPPPVLKDRVLDLADRYLELERAKEPEAMDMEPPIRLYQEVLASDAPEEVKAQAQAGLKEAQRWKRISDVMIQVNQTVEEPAAMAPYPRPRIRSDNEDDYLAVGWVEGRGKLLFRTATHKLGKGGETLYLLKSNDFRLNDFVGKRVGVRGTVIGWEGSQKVVLVEDIHVFRG